MGRYPYEHLVCARDSGTVSYTHLDVYKRQPYKDTKIPVAQFTAEGGYYFKILSDARKIVFVYAGASDVYKRQTKKQNVSTKKEKRV